MNDFEYDVLQRKRLAQQSKHKKNGSKSRKCTLPSDILTKKQLERMNGEVMTYNLNQPMNFQEFCKMPTDLQKLYITKLVDVLHMSGYDIARMFGCSQSTVVKTARVIGVSFPGKKKTYEQKQAVDKFISGEKALDSDMPQPKPEEPVNQEPSKPEPQEIKEDTSDMRLTNFTVCFDGPVDRERICRYICALVPAGTKVNIEIKCTIKED